MANVKTLEAQQKASLYFTNRAAYMTNPMCPEYQRFLAALRVYNDVQRRYMKGEDMEVLTPIYRAAIQALDESSVGIEGKSTCKVEDDAIAELDNEYQDVVAYFRDTHEGNFDLEGS